jgi:hypothetical protein
MQPGAGAAKSPATGSSVSASGASSGTPSPSLSLRSLPPPIQGPRTRLQQGIRQPKKYMMALFIMAFLLPQVNRFTLSDAMEDDRWCKAMEEEYNALMENNTWHLVPPNSKRNLIDCKWVYHVKTNADV